MGCAHSSRRAIAQHDARERFRRMERRDTDAVEHLLLEIVPQARFRYTGAHYAPDMLPPAPERDVWLFMDRATGRVARVYADRRAAPPNGIHW